MNSLLLIFVAIHCIQGQTTENPDTATLSPSETEDQSVINETITKYGLPQDYKKLDLPGPELSTDELRKLKSNKFISGAVPGEYTLRTRTITENFSYNGRYEESKIKKINNTEFPAVAGQFGEHFERKSGGFYIRTIGYTLDDGGYRQFLIDLTSALTTIEPYDEDERFLGGPRDGKMGLSSTALSSLIGGNPLG